MQVLHREGAVVGHATLRWLLIWWRSGLQVVLLDEQVLFHGQISRHAYAGKALSGL